MKACLLSGCALNESDHSPVDDTKVESYIQATLSSSTFSLSGQDFIKKKLSTCLEHHELCKGAGPGAANFIPTRLIDTEPGGIIPETTVRLVERIDGKDTQYAALSHCWGRAQLLRLTSDTQDMLLNGIQTSSLPTTFQHAVTVVRRLGIRYLWIDSLCIIQDSVRDWEVESSLMTDVYGHATVNIAASSSSDSRGGMVFNRDPSIVQPFAAYSPGGDNLVPGWYVWADDNRWRRIGDQPLNQRGWVLQERLLSTRTIHFTKSEIFWQCLEDLSSESVPNQVEDGRFSMPVTQIGDYTDLKLAVAEAQVHGLTVGRREKIFSYWWKLLAQYSVCRLTMDSDKLVAISGIVNYLEKLTGDECLAGLWRSEMPSCLLWSIDWGSQDDAPIRKSSIKDMETLRPRPENWRAPSWSWASHNLPIQFGFHGNEPLYYADIIEATVVRTPNGSVVSSRLVLECPVLTTNIDIPEEAEEGSIISGWNNGTFLSIGEGLVTEMYIETDVTIRCLPQVLYAGLILEGASSFFFILLIPSSHLDGHEITFQRIGTLEVREESLQLEDVVNEAESDVNWEEHMRCFEIV